MMNKIIALAIILIVFPSAYAENWKLSGKDEDGSYYIDQDSITIKNKVVSIKTKSTGLYKDMYGNSYPFIGTMTMNFNCSTYSASFGDSLLTVPALNMKITTQGNFPKHMDVRSVCKVFNL
jgi:hypothetical protein